LADYIDRIWCRDLVPSYPAGNKRLVTIVQAAAAWAQNAPQEPAADQATTVVQEAPAAPSPSVAAASVRGGEVELSCIACAKHPGVVCISQAYVKGTVFLCLCVRRRAANCLMRSRAQPLKKTNFAQRRPGTVQRWPAGHSAQCQDQKARSCRRAGEEAAGRQHQAAGRQRDRRCAPVCDARPGWRRRNSPPDWLQARLHLPAGDHRCRGADVRSFVGL